MVRLFINNSWTVIGILTPVLKAPIGASKKARLRDIIHYRVKVITTDSRQIIGELLAFDKHYNLVLADAAEFRLTKKSMLSLKDRARDKSSEKPESELIQEQRRKLGLIILRGETVISVTIEAPPVNQGSKLKQMKTGSGVIKPLKGTHSIGGVAKVSGPIRTTGGFTGAPKGFNPPPGFKKWSMNRWGFLRQELESQVKLVAVVFVYRKIQRACCLWHQCRVKPKLLILGQLRPSVLPRSEVSEQVAAISSLCSSLQEPWGPHQWFHSVWVSSKFRSFRWNKWYVGQQIRMCCFLHLFISELNEHGNTQRKRDQNVCTFNHWMLTCKFGQTRNRLRWTMKLQYEAHRTRRLRKLTHSKP